MSFWDRRQANIGRHLHVPDQIRDGATGTAVSLGGSASPNLPTVDEKAAMDGSATPSSGNVFATMADVPDAANLPSADEKAALDGAATPSSGNVVATMADIPDVATLPSADEKAALDGSATPSSGNVFATMADVPDVTTLPSSDEKDALDGSATPSSGNVFATMADVPDVANLPSVDEKAALDGAATPSSGNVFATMADVGGGGGSPTGYAVPKGALDIAYDWSSDVAGWGATWIADGWVGFNSGGAYGADEPSSPSRSAFEYHFLWRVGMTGQGSDLAIFDFGMTAALGDAVGLRLELHSNGADCKLISRYNDLGVISAYTMLTRSAFWQAGAILDVLVRSETINGITDCGSVYINGSLFLVWQGGSAGFCRFMGNNSVMQISDFKAYTL